MYGLHGQRLLALIFCDMDVTMAGRRNIESRTEPNHRWQAARRKTTPSRYSRMRVGELSRNPAWPFAMSAVSGFCTCEC